MSNPDEDLRRDEMNRSEAVRAERWEADRSDRDALRGGIEKDVSDIHDAPKRKTNAEGFEQTADIKEELEQVWQRTHYDADQAERDKREFDEFQDVKGKIKRTYGRDPSEGVKELLRAEELLRTNPEYALNFLRQQYGGGSYAQRVAQQEHTGMVETVTGFFEKHEIPKDVEAQMVAIIKDRKAAGQLSGNPERDLTEAYKAIIRGRQRVGRMF